MKYKIGVACVYKGHELYSGTPQNRNLSKPQPQ